MLTKALPWLLLVALTAVCACSVVSHPVKSTATTGVAFPALVNDADRYRGQTVVLGGYLLGTQNLESQTILTVLQAPLGVRDEPQSWDRSQGRFLVKWNGFLDPELYKKGRRVTVAGSVSGSDMRRVGNSPVAYLQLEGIEIHLWQTYENVYTAPYYPYYYGDYYDPWPWYGSFYGRFHFYDRPRPPHHIRPPHRPRPPYHIRPPHRPRPPQHLRPPHRPRPPHLVRPPNRPRSPRARHY